MTLKIKTISSLEKVFCDEDLKAPDFRQATAARGEIYSFQTALIFVDEWKGSHTFKIESCSELPLEIRHVVSTPSTISQFTYEENMLRTSPGLYPDLLQEFDEYIRLPHNQWQALWVTVRIPENCPVGKYPVKISVIEVSHERRSKENAISADAVFELEVLPFNLPESKLQRCEWIHCDCLASYYNVPVWSEKHWEIVEKFVSNAAAHDINVLYTPLWTPPLDTAVGGERPTTQLLGIAKNGSQYSFDFSKLERFITMGKRCGMKYFAMSHAFTQWGAYATPKIIAEVDGVEKRIFGWDVPANSPEYADFLSQLMPSLLNEFRKLDISDKVYFSISDEPKEKDLESYTYASELLKSRIGGIPTLDALSDFVFYQRGLVERPVVSNDHIEPFAGNVREMWIYYACICSKVPNRFFSFPSARNRIMGLMLYLYNASGFLQWGFNFYYSMHSEYLIDPFRDTNGDNWVPSGDAFMVYPGADGNALDSLRHEVFFDGLQDLRALRALENKIGRNAVIAMIQDGVSYTIDMENYPCSAEWLLNLRERINRKLAE